MAAVARGARRALLQLRPPLGAAGGRGVRALRRSPVRVLPSAAEQAQKERPAQARRPNPPARPLPEVVVEEEKWAGLRFEKAGAGDKRLSKVVTIARSRAFRERHGKILLEGKRLISDALGAGAVPQTIFFSTRDHLRELPAAKLKGASLVKVKFEEIKAWSDVVAPQGIIGIFSRPDHAKMTYPEVPQEHALPVSLICDNVRDPGNLGTILRSAAGAGCSRVLLVKGCVDAWEPKVLRAGMGAHFRLPILSGLEWDVVPNYLLPETCVHVADSARAEAGPSAKARSHGWISRPHNLKAQPAQPGWSSDSDGEEEAEAAAPVEIQHYCEPWMDVPVAVVIGGETEGVSADAVRLAESTGGRRLLIPVVPGVDSLNSAMAASILLFEGRRQLRQREEP